MEATVGNSNQSNIIFRLLAKIPSCPESNCLDRQVRTQGPVFDQMIDDLQIFLAEHHGRLLISERCNIPLSHSAKAWVSISGYEVMNCLMLGKGRRFYFYAASNEPFSPEWELEGIAHRRFGRDWISLVTDFLQSRQCRVVDTIFNSILQCGGRLTVRHLSQMDKIFIVTFVYPGIGAAKLSIIRSWMSAWRQIARCAKNKEELMQKACCPSRLQQIM